MKEDSDDNSRFPLKLLAFWAYHLFPKEKAVEILREVYQIIGEVYENREVRTRLFGGKSTKSIISGLFRLVGFRHGCPAGPMEIARILETTDSAIMKSCRLCLDSSNLFPEFEITGNWGSTRLVYHADWANESRSEGAKT